MSCDFVVYKPRPKDAIGDFILGDVSSRHIALIFNHRRDLVIVYSGVCYKIIASISFKTLLIT